ncbi:hypothetical protein GY45DRAFT_862531 [Cubamyces sp. BRFM 1775]|nr:hypothetical protein GY45DRAFT_862531 [Cubamyces sp. BRFM 1775]
MKNQTLQRLTVPGLSQSNNHTGLQDTFSQLVREWDTGPASALEHAPPPAFPTSPPSLSRHPSVRRIDQDDGAEEDSMDGDPAVLRMEELIDIERLSNSWYATPALASPPPSNPVKTLVRRQTDVVDLRKQPIRDAASLGNAASSLSCGVIPVAMDSERPPVPALRRSRRLQDKRDDCDMRSIGTQCLPSSRGSTHLSSIPG